MIIEYSNVRVEAGGRVTIACDSLRLTAQRTGVIGLNGSGKSTLVRLINGLIRPSAGRVLVDGLDTKTHAKAIRKKVGFVFQNPDLQIVMPTVAEDIAFSLSRSRLGETEKTARVDGVMEMLSLGELRNQPAHSLSGGEKQRLAIASVLVSHPQCLVLDEPTTMLDLLARRQFASLLVTLEQQVIVVSHDLDLLREFDEVVVVDRGRIVVAGTPAAAIDAYLELVRQC